MSWLRIPAGRRRWRDMPGTPGRGQWGRAITGKEPPLTGIFLRLYLLRVGGDGAGAGDDSRAGAAPEDGAAPEAGEDDAGPEP